MDSKKIILILSMILFGFVILSDTTEAVLTNSTTNSNPAFSDVVNTNRPTNYTSAWKLISTSVQFTTPSATTITGDDPGGDGFYIDVRFVASATSDNNRVRVGIGQTVPNMSDQNSCDIATSGGACYLNFSARGNTTHNSLAEVNYSWAFVGVQLDTSNRNISYGVPMIRGGKRMPDIYNSTAGNNCYISVNDSIFTSGQWFTASVNITQDYYGRCGWTGTAKVVNLTVGIDHGTLTTANGDTNAANFDSIYLLNQSDVVIVIPPKDYVINNTLTVSVQSANGRSSGLKRNFVQTSTLSVSNGDTLMLTRSAIQSLLASNLIGRSFGSVENIVQIQNLRAATERMSSLMRFFTGYFSLAESISKIAGFQKLFTNAFSLGDFASGIYALGRQDYVREMTQSMSITNIMQRLFAGTRLFSNSLSLADFVDNLASFPRFLTNSFSSTDAVSRVSSLTRSFTNTAAFSDVQIRIISLARTFSSQLQISEIAERLIALTRYFADNFIEGDATDSSFGSSKLLGNPFSLTSLTSKLGGSMRSFTGTLSLSTITSRLSVLARGFTIDFSLSQVTLRLSDLARSFVSQPSLSATMSRQLGKIISYTQEFSVNNLIQKFFESNKQLTNIFSFTEISSRLLSASRSFTGLFSLGSLNQNSAGFFSELRQSFGIDSIISRLSGGSREFSQTFGLSFGTSRLSDLTRSITYSISFAENFSRISSLSRIFREPFSFTGMSSRISDLNMRFSNIFSLNSLASNLFGNSKSFVNSFSLTHVTGRLASLSRSLTNVPSLSMITGRIASLTRTFSESFFIQAIVNSLRAIIEAVSPTQSPTSTSSSPGGSSGNVAAITPGQIVQPETKDLEFVSAPLLKESVAGQKIIHQIIVKGKSGGDIVRDLKLDVLGIPDEWVKTIPEKIDLLPGEYSTFIVEISIPENAPFADYEIEFVAKNGVVEDTSISLLRIKDSQRAGTESSSVVNREVTLLSEQNKAIVELNVKSQENVPFLVVKEEVPKTLAEDVSDIEFITPPDTVLRADPLFAWALVNVSANENTKLSYVLKDLPVDITGLLFFPINEFSLVNQQLPSGLRIGDVKVPMFYIGEQSTITVVVENTDSRQHVLNLNYDLPSGWKANPERIFGTLLPGEKKEFQIIVEIPNDEKVSNKIIDLVFEWDGNIFVKEYNVIVAQRTLVYFVVYVVIFAAASALFFFAFRFYRSRRIFVEYPAGEDRLAKLRKIRDMINPRKKEWKYNYEYRE